jgi:anti-sigma regulatory factor (Ser/Thr protein kinase)
MHTPAPRTLALRTISMTYPGTAEQIRVVRADLRVLLDDCPIADDVILCASELATNAAIHSRSRLPGGTLTVRASVSPEYHVLIEVEDNGGPGLQRYRSPLGTGSTSSVPSPTTGASPATTPSVPSGPDSTDSAANNRRSAPSCRRRVRTFFTVIKGTPSARQAGPSPAKVAAGTQKSVGEIASWSEENRQRQTGRPVGRAYSGAAACRALRAGAHRARRCRRLAAPRTRRQPVPAPTRSR